MSKTEMEKKFYDYYNGCDGVNAWRTSSDDADYSADVEMGTLVTITERSVEDGTELCVILSLDQWREMVCAVNTIIDRFTS